MIDKRNLPKVLLQRLAALPEGHAVDVRTYKRDRSVVFVRLAGGRFRIVARGFGREDFIVPEARLARTIRTLLAREFPRSNKVRLYMLGGHAPATGAAGDGKIIQERLLSGA